ncbi:hypothetical protein [Gibbsiella quercinecans]|uniref:hypothetical protein n=1 Tax=Gibbsiella quercinecans TaxID=929813 RepID=UPI002432C939|nr:hypothetical protein [Gibbsiella quercinecans]
MITLQGREAVWQHAKEAGMAGDIALIAKYFDIKDISIIFNGKLTYLESKPRRATRISVATKMPHSVKWYIEQAKSKKR